MLKNVAQRFAAARRARVRDDAVILMYHRIGVVERDPWRLAVTPARFAEQLAVIKDVFHPLPLQALRESIAMRQIPRDTAVITFDDGYRDNLTTAQPLLGEYDLPATLFVTTGYLDSERDFWWDELEDVCAELGTDSRTEWQRLQRLSCAERENALDELWQRAGCTRPAASRTMTSDDLLELASELFEIGAHTVSHPPLSTLTRRAQLEEIGASKDRLEALVGRPVTSFSYPHGDYSTITRRAVACAGFTTACTTVGGAVAGGSRPLELPRLHVLDWSGDEFEARLRGLLHPS
jgi:peptidoglycan/xylan/chitin deacetylase (PgdA/CDA1 family)